MSKIALSSNASGTGMFTIASPNSNTDRTLTLPDATGTVDRIERAGNVLQVVSATYSTSTNITTSSYTDSGLTASITPTSATSKILIIANLNGVAKGGVDSGMYAQLVRNSTSISEFAAGWELYTAASTNPGFLGIGSISVNSLDSPSTTSATTYKVQVKTNGNTATICKGPCTSSITLMEIAA